MSFKYIFKTITERGRAPPTAGIRNVVCTSVEVSVGTGSYDVFVCGRLTPTPNTII